MSNDQSIGDSQKRQLMKALRARIGEDQMETVGSLDGLKRRFDELKLSDDMSISDSKYDCATQVSIPNPVVEQKEHHKPRPDEIWIGLWGLIPRWKKGSTVNYTAYGRGYLGPDHAFYAAYRLYEAAEKWNNLDIGIKFKWVSKLEDAAFVLAYGGDGGSTLAKAFFPNDRDLNTVFVYQRAFQAGFVNNMANIFLHELGHVLGLRHEFAAIEGGAIQWGSTNPYSVMGYQFPPQIQQSDVTDTRSFYNFTGGSVGGYRVTDVFPDN
ncbi:zincin [Cadophora sp. DSE1049]|nr:zincin [Cadophora sp. DSE1049]